MSVVCLLSLTSAGWSGCGVPSAQDAQPDTPPPLSQSVCFHAAASASDCWSAYAVSALSWVNRMENHSSGDFQEKTNHPHHRLQVTVAGSSWWQAPFPGMPLCVIGMIQEVEFGPVAGSAAQRRPQHTGWWREGSLEAVGERGNTCLGPGVRPFGNACPPSVLAHQYTGPRTRQRYFSAAVRVT